MADLKALPRDWLRLFPAGANASGIRRAASPRADLFLAAFIVAVIALFILPLPQTALDGMISLNLAISVVLLTVSTYVPSAVSFSSFPASGVIQRRRCEVSIHSMACISGKSWM